MAARILSAGVVLVLAGCLSGGPTESGRDLYQWADGEGVVRYTSDPQRVPLDHRLSMVTVEAGLTAEENAAALPGARIEPDAEVVEPDFMTSGVPVAPPVVGGAVASTDTPAEAIPTELPADPFNMPEESARRASEATAEQVAAIDERMVELEIAIARDQETVKLLISDAANAAELRSSPELREIAERLPRLQAEMQGLQAERAKLISGDVP